MSRFIEKKDDTVSFAGLILIGLYCLLVSIFYRHFAQLHIVLPFLDFPVFVGEILLGICVILLFFTARGRACFGTRPLCYVLWAYTGWVLFKALAGHFVYGPLAYRNAALFYYPLFGIAAYGFYARRFFQERLSWTLLVILLFAKLFGGINNYYMLPYLLLMFVLASKIRTRWIRYALFILIIYIPRYYFAESQVPFTWDLFFAVSRSAVLGHVITFVFLLMCAVFVFLRSDLKYKLATGMLLLGAVFFVSAKYTDKNVLRIFQKAPKVIESFKDKDAQIQRSIRKDNGFPLYARNILLYSPEKDDFPDHVVEHVSGTLPSSRLEKQKNVAKLERTIDLAQKDARLQIMASLEKFCLELGEMDKFSLPQRMAAKEAAVEIIARIKSGEEINQIMAELRKDVLRQEKSMKLSTLDDGVRKELTEIIYRKRKQAVSAVPALIKELSLENDYIPEYALIEQKCGARRCRDLDGTYTNVLFRLFIWRDMLVELVHDRAWLGINWGKPQRSRSIEVLGWGMEEWQRDGWITPHNSFLHFIYRGGIVGTMIVAGLFAFIVWLIRQFIRLRSVTGIFLMGIFVYWLTIANFLVFLEFPYNAIPFWSLLGMTFAYYKDQTCRTL